MGLFNPKYMSNVYYAVEDSLPNIKDGMMVTAFAKEDGVLIKAVDKNEVMLPYDRIEDVQYVQAVETKDVDKSVIGRGVVGALVFGPVGAVVGGMSGIGKKSKTKMRTFMLIAFESKDGTVMDIPLEIGGGTNYARVPKLLNEIREKSGLEPIEVERMNPGKPSSITL